jgi:hypothetical protein
LEGKEETEKNTQILEFFFLDNTIL